MQLSMLLEWDDDPAGIWLYWYVTYANFLLEQVLCKNISLERIGTKFSEIANFFTEYW